MKPILKLVCLVGAAASTTATDGGECADGGRATKYDSCPRCGWRIHAPKTPGKYTLMRKYETVQEMRTGWACYMGGTGYPAPDFWTPGEVNQGVSGQFNFQHTFGRGYFYEFGPNPATMEDAIAPGSNTPWLVDPTAGMNKYDMGCVYKSDLLTDRDDGQPGFMMRAMRAPTLTDGYTTGTQASPNGPWAQAAANDVYTLRLETKDIFNGGLFGISVDSIPWGAGAWPAFWMVGSEPNDWAVDQPMNKGLGLRNYWPYRGEIDIVEYVNAYTMEDFGHEQRNHVTLHEPPGCFSNRSSPSGRGDLSLGGDDCNAGSAFTGCSISMGPKTVGAPDFPGAVYLCDWIKLSHVDCWFFLKNKTKTTTTAPDTTQSVVEIVVEISGDSTGWYSGDSLVLWMPGHSSQWAATFTPLAGPSPPPPPNFPPVAAWYDKGPNSYIAYFDATEETSFFLQMDGNVGRVTNSWNLNAIAGEPNFVFSAPSTVTIWLNMESTTAIHVGVRDSFPEEPKNHGIKVILKWETGLQLISYPSISVRDSTGLLATFLEFATSETSPSTPPPPARPLCGLAADMLASDGGTCSSHALWLLSNWDDAAGRNFAVSNPDAEYQVATGSQAAFCHACDDPIPPPPAPPQMPGVPVSYIATVPASAASSGEFQLSFSGSQDSWSGAGVILNHVCSGCPQKFDYTKEPGRTKRYEIDVVLAASNMFNDAELSRDMTNGENGILYESESADGSYYVKVRVTIQGCDGNIRACGMMGGDSLYAVVTSGDTLNLLNAPRVKLREIHDYPPPPPPWLGVEAGHSQQLAPGRRLGQANDSSIERENRHTRKLAAAAPSGPPVYEGFLGGKYPNYIAEPMTTTEPLTIKICVSALSDMGGVVCREDLNARTGAAEFEVPRPEEGKGMSTLALEFIPQTTQFKGSTLIEHTDATLLEASPPPPPPPPPPPSYPGRLDNPVEPFDIGAATTIDVKDLGPPDIRHELRSGCNMHNSLADMRLILNTVVCGQWAGNIRTTKVPGDPDGFSYTPQYRMPYATPECEAEFRKYMTAKPKVNGNRDYIHKRWDWTIKVWT